MSDEWWPNLRCRWCRSKTEQPRLKRAAFKVRRDYLKRSGNRSSGATGTDNRPVPSSEQRLCRTPAVW